MDIIQRIVSTVEGVIIATMFTLIIEYLLIAAFHGFALLINAAFVIYWLRGYWQDFVEVIDASSIGGFIVAVAGAASDLLFGWLL